MAVVDRVRRALGALSDTMSANLQHTAEDMGGKLKEVDDWKISLFSEEVSKKYIRALKRRRRNDSEPPNRSNNLVSSYRGFGSKTLNRRGRRLVLLVHLVWTASLVRVE